MRIHRDIRPLARTAKRSGWRLELTKKGHIRWLCPDGRVRVTGSSTPSDHHAVKNLRADLRREGLDV